MGVLAKLDARRRQRRDARRARCARAARRSCRCGVGRRAFARSSASAAPSSGRASSRIAADLMLGSRVDATLTAAGHHVTLAPRLVDAPLDEVDLVVADLDAEDAEALAGLGLPVLGYYSHVDVETKEAAEAAGIDLACRARGWRASCRSWWTSCSPRLTALERERRSSPTPTRYRLKRRGFDIQAASAGRARGPRRPIHAARRGSKGCGRRSGRSTLKLRAACSARSRLGTAASRSSSASAGCRET